MDTIKFEQLLGNYVLDIENAIGSNLVKQNFKKANITFYSNSDLLDINFYGIASNHITVQIDQKEVVRSISIHFPKVIDREFYDLFVKKYGNPKHTYIMSNMKEIISKEDNSQNNKNDLSFHQNLRKREGDLIEGTFDDKPLFMIWEKENFYIQAFLRHKQNISEVMFSLESPPFNIKPKK